MARVLAVWVFNPLAVAIENRQTLRINDERDWTQEGPPYHYIDDLPLCDDIEAYAHGRLHDPDKRAQVESVIRTDALVRQFVGICRELMNRPLTPLEEAEELASSQAWDQLERKMGIGSYDPRLHSSSPYANQLRVVSE